MERGLHEEASEKEENYVSDAAAAAATAVSDCTDDDDNDTLTSDCENRQIPMGAGLSRKRTEFLCCCYCAIVFYREMFDRFTKSEVSATENLPSCFLGSFFLLADRPPSW